LLHDVGKPPTFRVAERIRFDGHDETGVKIARGIMNRLRFSNEQMERVEALIANHMKFKDAGKMRESTLKRFLRQPHFEEHLELHRLDVLSSNGQLDNYELVKQRLQALPAEELKPPALLRGDDLIAAGYQPGPEFGEMLAAAEDAQLDGTVRTREEALELIRGRFGPPPTAPRP
jgi:tRNA nucleotidyltransferase/poly(A) polymerase